MLRRRQRIESNEKKLDREAHATDLVDVPAAVMCMLCGLSDCTGCDDDQSRSGIVSVVAWERIGVPALSRLWATARSSTRDAQSFFELLPDGPVMPALRFAALCELLAATSLLVSTALVLGVAAPDMLRHLAFDPHERSIALRVVVLGLPSFAGLLVLAHVAHGLSIDVGASQQGGRSARSRALRFGLYACGWDLVIGPLGVIVVAAKEGLSAAIGIAGLAAEVPGVATRAFLRGCYRLEGDRANRARTTAFVGAAVATGALVVVILAALLLVALLP